MEFWVKECVHIQPEHLILSLLKWWRDDGPFRKTTVSYSPLYPKHLVHEQVFIDCLTNDGGFPSLSTQSLRGQQVPKWEDKWRQISSLLMGCIKPSLGRKKHKYWHCHSKYLHMFKRVGYLIAYLKNTVF